LPRISFTFSLHWRERLRDLADVFVYVCRDIVEAYLQRFLWRCVFSVLVCE